MRKCKNGFVAGFFDVLHIGHLNLLKEAKARSEYLTVGVLESKAGENIPLNERIEILKAVRYTDEVTALKNCADFIRDAWVRLKYDIFFTADNYANDPEALRLQSWLRKRGADVAFLPYTVGQSEEDMRHRMEKHKILLFGAGKRFDRYMARKGDKHPPAFVFDNDSEKWGTTKHGILIRSPDELPELVKNGGKILITCANPDEIKAQLEAMGITEYYFEWKRQ